MGVSKNNGTPKSSILIGFSIVNHPFWGVKSPYFWKHPYFPLNGLTVRVIPPCFMRPHLPLAPNFLRLPGQAEGTETEDETGGQVKDGGWKVHSAGKSPFSTGDTSSSLVPFSIAILVYQRVDEDGIRAERVPKSSIPTKHKHVLFKQPKKYLVVAGPFSGCPNHFVK